MVLVCSWWNLWWPNDFISFRQMEFSPELRQAILSVVSACLREQTSWKGETETSKRDWQRSRSVVIRSLSFSVFLFLAPLIFFTFPLVLSVLNQTKIRRLKDRDWERKRGIGRKRERKSHIEQERLIDISHGCYSFLSLSLYPALCLTLSLSLSTSLKVSKQQ